MSEVSILKDYARMCNTLIKNCEQCGLNGGLHYDGCQEYMLENPEKAVEIITKWTKEHPIKTRQSEMLKMFPMTRLNDEGVIDIDPCDVNTSLGQDSQCRNLDCRICKKMFWKEEIR